MSAITLEGLGKRYWKLEEQSMLLKSLIPFAKKKRHEFWALRGIDLKIEEGETVGIVGHNGAGKTTLLRMLAGVTQPSEGRLTIKGRVSPLIAVGVGFHPEMSGRENIFVNGMLLGMSQAQIRERFDDIVAFSELQDFIDTPVKFYSSGMFMRLGFSVAVHVDPQVLLVDEILAVGDIAFQLKCFERMRQLRASGATVVIVSHSMHAIRLMCPRALLFRKGQLEIDGDAETVIARHHELQSMGALGDEPGAGTRPITILGRELVGPDGPVYAVDPGTELTARVHLRFEREIESPHIVFKVVSDAGQLAYGLQTHHGQRYRTYAAGEEAVLEVKFTARLGGGGSFRIGLQIRDADGRHMLLNDEGQVLYVTPIVGVMGLADLSAEIHLDGEWRGDQPSLLIGDLPAADA